jgi:hypothetical protein
MPITVPKNAELIESRPIGHTEYLSAVLCKLTDRDEYVTWIYNHDHDGCFSGHYFDNIVDAAKDYEERR